MHLNHFATVPFNVYVLIYNYMMASMAQQSKEGLWKDRLPGAPIPTPPTPALWPLGKVSVPQCVLKPNESLMKATQNTVWTTATIGIGLNHFKKLVIWHYLNYHSAIWYFFHSSQWFPKCFMFWNKTRSFYLLYIIPLPKCQSQFIYPFSYWWPRNLFPVFLLCCNVHSFYVCPHVHVCKSFSEARMRTWSCCVGGRTSSALLSCHNALHRGPVPPAVQRYVFLHFPSATWYSQTLKVTLYSNIRIISGKNVLPMYHEVFIKHHILNSFSKAKDFKIQNKCFSSRAELEDPGLCQHFYQKNISHKNPWLAKKENTHLKLSKQFRNKQSLWKFGHNLINRKWIEYKYIPLECCVIKCQNLRQHKFK